MKCYLIRVTNDEEPFAIVSNLAMVRAILACRPPGFYDVLEVAMVRPSPLLQQRSRARSRSRAKAKPKPKDKDEAENQKRAVKAPSAKNGAGAVKRRGHRPCA